MSASSPRLWLRTTYLMALLLISWCVMLMSHELGHLLGGKFSGGTLKDYDLRPWRLPYSIFYPDPHPLITLWCGPLFGALAPLGAAMAICRPWAWFIADFCVLANGVYLAGAWLTGDQYLDTTQLFAKGASAASVAAYCILTIGWGYFQFRRDCLAIFDLRGSKKSAPHPNE